MVGFNKGLPAVVREPLEVRLLELKKTDLMTMGTALKDRPTTNQSNPIDAEIAQIVKIILDEMPQECLPRSILWHGGCARGDTGWYRYKERQLPFGDYDLEVVCPEIPPAGAVIRIRRAILKRFGYRPVDAPVDETLAEDAATFNVIDMKFSTPEQFQARSPDLSTYDLLHASQVVFGEDPRGRLTVDLEQVPLFSAYRIMQNRLFQAVSLFKLDLWDSDCTLTHQEKVAYALAICRIWIEFSSALTLSLGVYAPDFKTRLENLEQEGRQGRTWFRNWEQMLEGIRAAVNFKRNPRPDQLNAKAIRHGYFLALESWDRVMRVLQAKLLPYYFGRDYELDKIDYWFEAADTCLSVLPRSYYREYLKTMCSRKGKRIQSDLALNLLATAANVYENLAFRGPSFLALNPKRARVSPEIVYFACVPLLAYSITPVGKVHYGMLKQVINLVGPYKRCHVTLTGRENWQEVKDFCCELFAGYRSRKGQIRRLPRWLGK